MPNTFFHRPFFWVIFAGSAFLLLPVYALDYGLFRATSAEILQAMGWSGINLSWAWFFPLGLFLKPLSPRLTLYMVCGLSLFIFLSAKLCNIGLGYAVFCLALSLIALAVNALAALNDLKGDRFLLAALIGCVLLIGFFIVYPIISVLVSMFYQGGNFSPAQPLVILQKPYILRVIGHSLSVAVTVGILSTFLGLVLAVYTTRIARRSAFISKIFAVLPIVTPPFVVGLGVTLMLGRSGYVTDFLTAVFNLPSNWLYGFNGIVIAHTLALTPMAFMILEGALKAIPPTLEEAAYSLRANTYQTFYTLVLPLLKPALANAFLVVAIQSLADFSTPLVLGGNFDVIATQIYFAIAGSQLDYVTAGTLGTVLLLFSLAIFLIQYFWLGKTSYITVSGKSAHRTTLGLPKGLKYGVGIIFAGWSLFNVILYGSIFYGSFTLNWGVDYTLTLKNYQTLFGQGFNDGAWPSLIQTVILSAVAAPLTAFFGLLIAYITVRKRFKGKKAFEFLTLLCFAVPGTVTGVSYILAFNQAPLYLTGTAIIIVLSMVMRNMPIGMRAAVAGLEQVDKSLDEASLSLKADSFKTLRFILLPLLKPAFISALVTAFVRAMTTVSAIIFLVTAETRVATSYILNRVEDGEYGTAIAYGAILIVVMMGIILLFERLVGRSRTEYSQNLSH